MTVVHPTLFPVSGLSVKRLSLKDNDALQALLEKCSDYFQLVEHQLPGPTAAHSLMIDRPKGKSLEAKAVLGFFMDPQVLIGLIDFVTDYPSPGDWWIGLLLLDPAYRSQGLGLRIYRAFETWASQCRAERICLGVIEQNRGAYRFWQKAGFEPLKRPAEQKAGGGEHRVIAMTRSL